MKNHLELKQEEESKKLTNQELQRRIDNCRGYSESSTFWEMIRELFTKELTFREMDAISSQVYQIELNRRGI